MKTLVGIGNPGNEYKNTKHNIGFEIIDKFALKHNLEFRPSKHDYLISKGMLNSVPYHIIKPVTFVNLTGIAIKDYCDYFRVDTKDILVLTDDLNLDIGKIRIRRSGGDGGHNGIKSILYHLLTDEFPRLRFGIGSDFEDGEMSNYVLSLFPENIRDQLNLKIDFAVRLCEEFITGGIQNMLDFFSDCSNTENFNKL